MRFFTRSALAAAALLSVAVTVPFLPGSHSKAKPFALEADLTSNQAGRVQVYFDSGAGFSDAESTSLPLEGSATPKVYRLPLPAGDYRALRFDPNDRDGTVTIGSARVLDERGRIVREFTLEEFRPQHQIAAMEVRGARLVIEASPGADDPQLLLTLNPPLALHGSWFALPRGWLLAAGLVFAVLAAVLAVLERAPGLAALLFGGIRRLAARPGRAVAAALAALLAFPAVRHWLVRHTLPTLRQTGPRLIQVVGHPGKVTVALGGNVALTMGYVLAFDASLAAFGQHLSLIQVAMVYLVGNAAGAAIPTPGGIGTIEVALIGGLTASGLNAGVAASVVVLFRVVSFWLPIPIGWVALRYLRRTGEI